MANITVINPATEKETTYACMSKQQVHEILEDMDAIQHAWVGRSFADRQKLMHQVAKILRANLNEYATVITEEMGKPMTQSIGEIEKCALLCDYYATHAEGFLQDEEVKTEHQKSYRCYRPLGIVFAIMPWNFPFWQVLRFAVPNLMAGNAGVLSHAPNSTLAALTIERIFEQAGFPKGLFRSLVIDVDLAPFVIHHPKVRGVTLTGSNRAGTAVASQAGQAMKKVVLELGGSDPYVVLEDADLDVAAQACIQSRLSNAGQVCIAAKRLIVVDAVRDQFEQLLKQKMAQYVCQDPLDAKTLLGPMAREDLRLQLHEQVQRTIASGATCVLGGQLPEGQGYYYPATLLVNVNEHSPAFKEELFGPVVCVVPARDTQHAIKLANQTPFGLGAAVFTQDLKLGEHIAANQLNAGTCYVNGMVGSDPRLPFGGTKSSGFGRELSCEGIREFMNIKTVVVA